MAAVEVEVVGGEQALEDTDRLVEALDALGGGREVEAQPLVLLLVPAAPRPTFTRPPDTWSTVTTSAASSDGWRYVTPVTSAPSRICVVTAPRAASRVHASRQGPMRSP